jgi:hypothetical protein
MPEDIDALSLEDKREEELDTVANKRPYTSTIPVVGGLIS